MRRMAFDIVQRVMKQGLAHPLKCIPTLIALMTMHHMPQYQQAASALYSDAVSKYESFIHN